MRKKTFLFAVFLSLMAVIVSISHYSLAAPITRQAPPSIPHQISGYVRVNDIFVPIGTQVSAWCGGVKVAEELTVDNGGEPFYLLRVYADDPNTHEKDGCVSDEEISFKIDNLDADQTIEWRSGGNDTLDLSASQDSSKIYLPLILK